MLTRIISYLAIITFLLLPVAAVDGFPNLEKPNISPDYRFTPVNPEFIKFFGYNSSNGGLLYDREGHSMGLIPSPIVLKSGMGQMNAPVSPDPTQSATPLNKTVSVILKSIEQYRISPVNPEFRKFIDEYNAKNSQESDFEGHPLGLIPSPIDLGMLTSIETSDGDYSSASTVNSPASAYSPSSITTYSPSGWFDLRLTNKLTPVRDQEQCGACWAFSTYGSLESTNLPGTKWDFSENNMKNTHGFDLAACKGGNYLMSTAYLSRWSGPVSETSDPFTTSSSTSPGNVPVVQHVQDVIFLPSRTGPLDNTRIKQLLQENGAVYSQIRWESGYYNKNAASYYYPGSSSPNHAIVIVGWDDAYSRTRFSTTPPGDGAFIVRNSWGDDWGENGYCYISYYDTNIGRPSAQFLSETTSNYDKVYQYDPLGWVTSVGVGGESAWFANVFTSSQNEELKAVSFYAPVANAQYQIEVFNDVASSPRGRSASLVQQGSIPFAGYHTIALQSAVPLHKGQQFSVIINLVTPGFSYPISVEYPIKGYSSRASAHPGESWVSSDGISWTDLTTLYSNTNVCLKAFTDTVATTPTYNPTIKPTVIPTMPAASTDRWSPSVILNSPKFMAAFSPGDEIQIEWSAKDNVAVTSVIVDYSIDNGKTWITLLQQAPATGSCSLTVPENLSGSITLRVRALDAAGNTGSANRSVTIKSGGFSAGSFSQPKSGSFAVSRNLTATPALQTGYADEKAYIHSDNREQPAFPSVTRPVARGGVF